MTNILANDERDYPTPPPGYKKGYARDYERHPFGYSRVVKAFDLPLIPENEWAERLEYQKATKSRLSDIRNRGLSGRPIPSLDQNGVGYCHTADTEILTDKGWVEFPTYDWQSPVATVNPLTHAMEFQQPFERHAHEYDGPIIYSTNRRIDFGVTPDHEMYVRKWDERRRTLSNQYSFIRASDIGWYAGLLAAPSGQIGTELVELEIPGDRRYDGDDLIALVSLIVSDGFAADYGYRGKLISFASFRPELMDSVRALASRVGFREQPSRPGVFNRWGAGALYEWISEQCYVGQEKGARAKCVPQLVKCASQRQIKHFLQWFGDRSYNQNYLHYYSASKRLIDDIQELHLRIGERSSIGQSAAKTSYLNGQTINGKGGYTLTVASDDRLCIDRKKHIETDHYKGVVYCAGVPNHTLLTRRNGSVLISSNCWCHGPVSALLLARAVAGLPFVDLSPFAVGCLIKNYRDEGGWGIEAMEFMAERGCPSSAFWPHRAMRREYDTPATWANAKLHIQTEWMELEPRNKAQMVTCLLSNLPICAGYDHWAHEVCLMDLENLSPLRVRLWNSWSDNWEDNGTGILEGSKALGDGWECVRVVTPSTE